MLPEFGVLWHELTEEEREYLSTDPELRRASSLHEGGFHIAIGLSLMARGKDQSVKDYGAEMLRSVRPDSPYLYGEQSLP